MSAAAPAELDLDRLDAAVEAAIAAGEAGSLQVLGYGEITLVIGWPSEAPTVAVKRLPPFRDRDQVERYAQLLDDYVAALRERGVAVVDTHLRTRADADGGWRAYLVQPLAPREQLLDEVLRRTTDHQTGAALLDALARRAVAAVDARVGLDAQASNWVLAENGELSLLDLSTPLLRDGSGADRLDLGLFLSIYPWALRKALRRIARDVMAQYHDPRTVLLDAASNLHKERLDQWIPPFLASANAHVDPPLDAGAVRRYFTRDRRLWLLMQRLRRADRAWQRAARRRGYPFLLPPPYDYGPQELPRGGDSP